MLSAPRAALAAAALLAALVAGVPAASAATFAVTKTADTYDGTCDSDCSLREAITAARNAAGVDTVTIPAGTFKITLPSTGDNNNTNGNFNINSPIDFMGAGVGRTIIDGNGHAIANLYGSSSDTISFHDLTFTGAGSDPYGGEYGGIWAAFGQTLILDRVAFDGGSGPAVRLGNAAQLDAKATAFRNQGPSAGDGAALQVASGTQAVLDGVTFAANFTTLAVNGGAIASAGTLRLTNATFAGNTAGTTGAGGAIYVSGGTAKIEQSTFTGGSAAGGGAELRNAGGSVTLRNSVIATGVGACSGAITSLGHNVDRATSCALGAAGDRSALDPKLGILGPNGSATPWVTTLVPLADSPLVDAGDNAACTATDARALPRPNGPVCDIGAAELERPDLNVDATAAPTTPAPGATVTYTVKVRQKLGAPADGVTVATPAGTPITAVSSDHGTCSADAAGAASCAIGTLAAGETATITLQSTMPAAAGRVTRAFSATAALADRDPSDDTATVGIDVTVPPAGGTTPPPGGGAADKTAPVISKLKVTGQSVRFTLSEAAKVKLVIARERKGHRAGKRCSPKTRRGKRCTVVTTVVTVTRSLKAGAVSTALPRVRGRALPAGAYRVTVVATDAAGNRSKSATKRFTRR